MNMSLSTHNLRLLHDHLQGRISSHHVSDKTNNNYKNFEYFLKDLVERKFVEIGECGTQRGPFVRNSARLTNEYVIVHA